MPAQPAQRVAYRRERMRLRVVLNGFNAGVAFAGGGRVIKIEPVGVHKIYFQSAFVAVNFNIQIGIGAAGQFAGFGGAHGAVGQGYDGVGGVVGVYGSQAAFPVGALGVGGLGFGIYAFTGPASQVSKSMTWAPKSYSTPPPALWRV